MKYLSCDYLNGVCEWKKEDWEKLLQECKNDPGLTVRICNDINDFTVSIKTPINYKTRYICFQRDFMTATGKQYLKIAENHIINCRY